MGLAWLFMVLSMAPACFSWLCLWSWLVFRGSSYGFGLGSSLFCIRSWPVLRGGSSMVWSWLFIALLGALMLLPMVQACFFFMALLVCPSLFCLWRWHGVSRLPTVLAWLFHCFVYGAGLLFHGFVPLNKGLRFIALRP